jgi:Fur family iron response transcriptional regulator
MDTLTRLSSRASPAGLCEVVKQLRNAGLRPTRQRVALATIILGGDLNHISAEALHAATRKGCSQLSLATVYNTLEAFVGVGLIRRIAITSRQALYDQRGGDHHHFLIEGENRLMDVPEGTMALVGLPQAPPGFQVIGVDVVVRLRRSATPSVLIAAEQRTARS